MPRNERRPVTWSRHAAERLVKRGIAQESGAQMIRAGAWTPDGVGDHGEPKWRTQGSFAGQTIRVIFVETTKGDGEVVVEVLHVLTVIAPERER